MKKKSVAKRLNLLFCVIDNERLCLHVPKSVETSQDGKVIILWNQKVQTDRTIHSNKPDIKISDNKKGTCVLIDIAISGDGKVIKEAGKFLEYKDLIIELHLMGNMTEKVIEQ